MQKTDTGKIYAMKTLKKEEMLKKDQVRINLATYVHCDDLNFFPARARPRRARRAGRIQLTMGRPALLLFPGSRVPLPHHGVLARWRLDDDAHQVRYVL